MEKKEDSLKETLNNTSNHSSNDNSNDNSVDNNEVDNNEIDPMALPIKEDKKENEIKIDLEEQKKDVEWPNMNLSNITYDIKLTDGSGENDWENCKKVFSIDYYIPLLNIYKTGDIIDLTKMIKYEFTKDNYIETTNYERSEIDGEKVLVAGDILTFKTRGFDFAIFVTEVSVNNQITSRINTSIYEKPENSYIYDETKPRIFSTAKDSLGNCYVLKKIGYDQDEQNYDYSTIKKIFPFLNIDNNLEPSNLSHYDPEGINNDNSPYASKYYYDTIFEENRLIYDYDKLIYKGIKGTNNIIIPNEEEVAKKSEIDGVKPFDCNIKGFFSVHRSKMYNEEPITQCMNFEIYFENEIKSNFIEDNDTQTFKSIEINFMECIKDDQGNYRIYLKDDPSNSSCFFSGGGFYNNNQYNPEDQNTNNNLFQLEEGINDFHIYSPYFFTDQSKPYTKKPVYYKNKRDKPFYMEDYKNENMDMLKSLHMSSHPNEKNEKGCNIV